MNNTNTTDVFSKLQYVQQNLKAPKGQYNKFGEYHYRSCEDIQEALKPLLAEVNAVLLLNDELVMIGDRYYIKAAATFQDAESTGSVTNTAYARETDSRKGMEAAQVTGSTSSYARKYALNGLFCIDDAKDPDTMDNRDQGQRGQPDQRQPAARQPERSNNSNAGSSRSGYVERQHINTIRAEIARTGAKEKAVCYQYRIKDLSEMKMEQFKDAMKIFRSMPDKVNEEENYQMTLAGIAQYEDEMPFR